MWTRVRLGFFGNKRGSPTSVSFVFSSYIREILGHRRCSLVRGLSKAPASCEPYTKVVVVHSPPRAATAVSFACWSVLAGVSWVSLGVWPELGMSLMLHQGSVALLLPHFARSSFRGSLSHKWLIARRVTKFFVTINSNAW